MALHKFDFYRQFVFATNTLKFFTVYIIVFSNFHPQLTDWKHSRSKNFYWDTWICTFNQWKYTACSAGEKFLVQHNFYMLLIYISNTVDGLVCQSAQNNVKCVRNNELSHLKVVKKLLMVNKIASSNLQIWSEASSKGATSLLLYC